MAKTILILAFLGMLVLIWVYREQEYLRDPLATVYRDGVQQSGVEVFQNYSDDVLIEKNSDPGAYRILIQSWNQTPGTPAILRCLIWTACLTDDDHAAIYPLGPTASPAPALRNKKGKYDPNVSMTNHEVSFTDPDGTRVRVVLR